MPGFKHFFSPPIMDPELQVRGIGIHELMPAGRVVRPQGTGDFLFMLFHDPVLLDAGDGPEPAPAGSLMLWPAGAGHDYGSAARPWDHSWLHCDGTRVLRALRGAGLPLGRPLTLPEPDRLVRRLEAVYAEVTGARPDPVIVGNLLENMLREAARGAAPPAALRIPPAFLALRRRLELAPGQPARLADLARAVHLSASHFSARWRRYFAVSPIEDVIRMRIEQAKYLLLDRTRRVGEVAAAVGIEDPYRFSRLFRRRVGLSPRAYRAGGASRERSRGPERPIDSRAGEP
jgi:AraC-like DNA-binding protein